MRPARGWGAVGWGAAARAVRRPAASDTAAAAMTQVNGSSKSAA